MSRAAYMREYRAGHPQARVYDRWMGRTYIRALRRLAAEYPARFAELVEAERRAEPDPRLNGGSTT